MSNAEVNREGRCYRTAHANSDAHESRNTSHRRPPRTPPKLDGPVRRAFRSCLVLTRAFVGRIVQYAYALPRAGTPRAGGIVPGAITRIQHMYVYLPLLGVGGLRS